MIADRQFVGRVLTAVGVIALAVAAWRLRAVALLLFGAIVFALFLTRLSTPLARRARIGEGLALAATAAGLVLALGVVLAFFGWRLQAQISQATVLLPRALHAFVGRIEAAPIGAMAVSNLDKLQAGAMLPTLARLPGYALSTLAVAADLALVLVGGVYLAAQPRLYREGLLALLPSGFRPRAAEAVDECGDLLGRWLVAQLLVMATVGSMVGVGLWAIGVPAPGALGLLAALAEIIPFAGPIAAAVPALLLALLYGLDRAGWTLALFVVVQQVETHLLIPLIQRRIVFIPPVLGLFALVSFALIFGPLGILFATPLTVALIVMVKRLYLAPSLPADGREGGAKAGPPAGTGRPQTGS